MPRSRRANRSRKSSRKAKMSMKKGSGTRKNRYDDFKAQSESHAQQFQEIEKFMIPELAGIVVDYAKHIARFEGENKIYEGEMLDGKKEGEWLVYSKQTGRLVEKRWYRNNIMLKNVTFEWKNGHLRTMRWYEDGKPHYDGRPAVIWYFPDGKVEDETWYQHGKKHRTDGPASIHFYDNGAVETETWYLNNKQYRPGNDPSNIDYDPDGTIRFAAWTDEEGKSHREGAPALIWWNADGTIEDAKWYIHDVKLQNNLAQVA